MYSTSFNASGKLDVKYQINRNGSKEFTWDTESEAADGSTVEGDYDVTASTWELFIKRFKGDREKTLSLTLGAGLSFPVYTTNTILAEITAVQSRVEEGEYYWELVNLTENKTRISGKWFFTYDPQE